ncbi:bifunctional PIG-L family deacetylase/class I SAM-dependent methyltransferase [Allokutzneria sp. NRRL B-24872]|uniref:bifunctional PIG-L family deacetylase/class I SAM-dependent methyltransferase n=1 Tax=Allokutzneria sp. NRRL B-24872 TaxID=1137961 RepID=UPI000A3959C1|nr:bifunctional PIG-L family deacetylase/class I SAM-dependent methyltransferase [Allokutzneria sp. NRRL B-24872]
MSRAIAEELWSRALADPTLRPFPAVDASEVLVVAAHPDDETLGAAGLLQRLHADGCSVTLVVATDGEAAFPAADRDERLALGRVRRGELTDSLRRQGLHDVDPIWLGLPDSGLRRHSTELEQALSELAAGTGLCLFPWPEDPHPDHQEAGRAALRAAPLTTHCWSYPIWMWHWISPQDPGIPWSRAFAHHLTETERAHKAAAISRFTSQLTPGPRDEPPILPSDVLAHFDRDAEVFFREPPRRSAPPSRFAEIYDSADDPWQVESSWYERRKRAVMLAALPRQRYGFAVEPACGTGILTRELARRCDRMLAFDPVPQAVRRARTANSGSSHVDVRTGALPESLPAEGVDLLVYSEILYYLDDGDLAETVRRSVAALRPGGHLLAAHWLPWAAEAPRDGLAAHHHLVTHPDLELLIEHLDKDFVVHVLRRG